MTRHTSRKTRRGALARLFENASNNRGPRRLHVEGLEPRTLMAVIDDPMLPTVLTFFDSASPLISEGQTLDLSAVKFEGDATGVTFAYDFNGDSDGTTGLEISGLADPAIMVGWSELPSNLNNGYSETLIRVFAIKAGVVLEVDGSAIIADTTLTITNTAPEITSYSVIPSGSGCGGDAVSLTASFTDPGYADLHTIEVNWGDGVIESLARQGTNGAYTVSANHSFVTGGDHTVSITITETVDLESDSDSKFILEGSGGGGPQTVCFDAETGIVTITGSDNGDTVVVNGPSANIRISADFLPGPDQYVEFPAAAVTKIVALLGDGNDVFTVAGGVSLPVVAVGGAGADTLTGGRFRNILIGGIGADTLYGGRGEDILIGGSTDHDTSSTALLALLAEWSSSHSLETRVRNLVNGSGSVTELNGTTFLTETGGTIHDDGAIDTLLSAASTDWLFLNGAAELLLALGSNNDLIGDDLDTLF